jgi:hypothetical protein
MLTDSSFARIADRALRFGFRKQAARFDMKEHRSVVARPDGKPLLSFSRRESEAQGRGSEPALAHEGTSFAQRLLGRLPEGGLSCCRLGRVPVDAPVFLRGELRLHAALTDSSGMLLPPSSRVVSARRQKMLVELGPPHVPQQLPTAMGERP